MADPHMFFDSTMKVRSIVTGDEHIRCWIMSVLGVLATRALS